MVAGPEVELMAENEALPRPLSRREFGTITLAGLPLALAFQKVDSTIKGVQIGVQSYPANIEYQYPGTDVVAEVGKCYQFCKDALAST